MKADEEAIHTFIEEWQNATRAGDIDTLLSLLDDEVKFLLPAQAPMTKQQFAEQFQAGFATMHIDATSQIQEIEIAGSWAYCWNYLTVTITQRDNNSQTRRSGNILTIFKKQDEGRWVIYRDANLLTIGAS